MQPPGKKHGVFKKLSLRIVALSDTHSAHQRVLLPKGDVIIHAGDITLKGELAEVKNFLNWFANLTYKHKIFIAGNHDFALEKMTDAAVASLLPPGITYLKDSGVTIDGIAIWGTPVTPWYFNWAFNRHRGAAILKHWNQIPVDTAILVTHGPAFGVLDVVENGNHIGDKDLLRTILELKPAVHLCGHVHESFGKTKRGITRFFNASIMNEKYEIQNNPLVFDV